MNEVDEDAAENAGAEGAEENGHFPHVTKAGHHVGGAVAEGQGIHEYGHRETDSTEAGHGY